MCFSLSSSISIRYKIKKHDFIHNPKGDIQPVRVRYGAASLIQNDLFAVHQKAVDFLSSLGFTITKEKISRLDLQAMLEHKTSEFIKRILCDYAVRRARNDVIHRQAGEGQTYTVGKGTDLELCIYDKKADLRRCIVEDPIKFKLTVEHCIGSDWYFSDRPLTRIEFRLWRTSLRFLNINSVEDLRRKEKGLVDWLTINWFRLLAKPKVKGHEYDAPIHSLWLEVRAAFHRWFPGTGDDVPVEWKIPTAVSCPAPLLLKQGLGCIAKVAALMFGRQKRTEVLQKIFHSLLDSHLSLLSDKVNGIAGHLETLRGVCLGVKERQVPAFADGCGLKSHTNREPERQSEPLQPFLPTSYELPYSPRGEVCVCAILEKRHRRVPRTAVSTIL